MFILNFREILWGKGYDNIFIKDMLEHIQNLTPFFLHQGVLCHCPFLLELFTPLVELGIFHTYFALEYRRSLHQGETAPDLRSARYILGTLCCADSWRIRSDSSWSKE